MTIFSTHLITINETSISGTSGSAHAGNVSSHLVEQKDVLLKCITFQVIWSHAIVLRKEQNAFISLTFPFTTDLECCSNWGSSHSAWIFTLWTISLDERKFELLDHNEAQNHSPELSHSPLLTGGKISSTQPDNMWRNDTSVSTSSSTFYTLNPSC